MADIVRETVGVAGIIHLQDGSLAVSIDPPSDRFGFHQEAKISWAAYAPMPWRDAVRFQNLLTLANSRARQLEQNHTCGTVR